RRVAGAAGLPARAQRIEVEFVVRTLARAAVLEWPSPGVFRHLVALQVRAAPACHALRLGDQRLQSLVGGRVDPDIKLVDVEHAGEPLDRLMRDLLLGGAELP